MKSLGIFKHKNPMRHNYWVETFRDGTHLIKFYTPTPSSRKRISRIIRKMYRFHNERMTIFFAEKPPIFAVWTESK